jgi:nucleoside-diphosphate-sugar epimerase
VSAWKTCRLSGKACGDMIAQAYAASYNLPVTVTRCGNFYGGGDLNWNRVADLKLRRGIRPSKHLSVIPVGWTRLS